MAVLFFISSIKSAYDSVYERMSLQVPLFSNTCLVRRVHPCISGFRASMTIEAALAFPLAVFLFLALLQPVTWLDRQRKVQTCMERIGEEISQYGILAETDDTEGSKEIPAFCTDAAAALWVRGRVSQYADHVLVKQSEVYGENGEIGFRVEYYEKIPFFERLLGKQTVTAGVRRRAWTGIRGKLKGNGMDGNEKETDAGEHVYVGAGMGRYHLFRDCHYISNEYQAVTKEQAERAGSFSKKRTPCAVCSRRGTSSDMVYITAAGEHYHYDKNCTSMISYVQEIPKTQAEHLGLCSYCARKKGGEE